MGRTFKLAIACGVLAAFFLGATAVADPSFEFRARKGVRFLVSSQMEDGSIRAFSDIASTSDAILAMVAARRAPGAIDDAVGFLRDNPDLANTVGEKAKVVMALVAAGRSPRSFAGQNLVAEIKDGRDENGAYGELEQSQVYDQALAILALSAADAPVPRKAIEWLSTAQCGDGGWQFDQPPTIGDDEHCSNELDSNDYTVSDTNTTATVVMAINARPSTVSLPEDPFVFIRSARDPHLDGWVYDPTNKCLDPHQAEFCYRTDTNSTALVLQAYAAEGIDPPRGGRRALSRLQWDLCGKNAGAFAFTWVRDGKALRLDGPNLGATIQAIPGLLGKPLPIKEATVTKPAPRKACS